MHLILLRHRLFSDVRRKMTCVKLSTIWTKFRIVLEGDLFLSNKEHTRFPSILLGGDVPFLPKVLGAGRVSVQAGEAAGWSGAEGGCWDGGCLGILLNPGLSRMFPGLKEERGQTEAVSMPELITTLVKVSRLGHLIQAWQRMGNIQEKEWEELNSGYAAGREQVSGFT